MFLVTEAHVGAGDPFGADEDQSPIRELLARVGGRWSLDVLVALGPVPRSFGELSRAIPGVSRRLLALTLRGLERDGLLARNGSLLAPDRASYALTKLGLELAMHVRALSLWSERNRDSIYAARDRYDGANALH
jgi:DNA-binding HxlR family transcriptional regulator